MANPITNFFDKMISDRVNKAVESEISKKATSSDIVFSGFNRSLSGDNKTLDKPNSRGVSFNVLRSLANYYPIARACVNYRKFQMSQLDWDISPLTEIQEEQSHKLSEEDKKTVKELKQFFKYPTGDKEITFRHFLSQVLEDVLVIDALALYRRKTRAEGIYGYLPVDGATIKLRINEDGSVPQPPEVAYTQVINGKEVAQLTTEDLIYRIMNPRTITPYGMAPLETLVVTVSTALKLQSYNLGYLTEGNVPEGFVELPQEVASSPEQLTKWQQTWDAIMSGDPRAMSRLRFLPAGMKYTPTKKPEDMSYERFERWLLQNTCAVFAVAPQDIGFTYEVNKATSETQWQVGKEKGMLPTASFIKEIFDHVIQEDLGYENFEFVWTNLNPTNAKEEADVFAELVGTGAVSVDEWRAGEGLDPIGLGHYIKTAKGVVLVKDFLAQETTVPQNNNPDNQQNNQTNNQGNQNNQKPNPKTNEQKKKPASTQTNATTPEGKTPTSAQKIIDGVKSFSNSSAGIEDLRKWKKAAAHDLERGRPLRDFKTGLVDSRVQTLIKDGLKKATNSQEINELFEPFLSPESRVINAVLDLYEDLERVLEN